jgi:thiamine biosynthesis lipoprotein
MRADRFPAMGTEVLVVVPERRASAPAAIQELFAEWERCLSRFRADSELCALNRRAGAWLEVSPLLFRVLERALAAAAATDGVFDPTLLGQLVALGYDRSFGDLPHDRAACAVTIGPGGGWRGIALDPARRRVMVPAGAGLDLGGIAKGMAVDAALELLRVRGIDTALVNAGGDLAVRGTPPGLRGWPVAVQAHEGSVGVMLRGGALATSSVGRRRWPQGGRTRHHLLDPRTGEPAASGLWSVSVAASRCDQAEVAAKAALILGPHEGAALLARHGLAGLLVDERGARRAVGAWPHPGAEAA